jgi:type II secretory pathway pseudopilin PulG
VACRCTERSSPAGRDRGALDAGLTVIEVVMAVVVVAVASSMALVVLSGSARSAVTTRQGDAGLTIASAALESAAVFDCGTTTAMLSSGAGDLTNPDNPVPGSLTTRYQRCVPAARAAVGDLGGVAWRERDGNVTYDVSLATNWVLFRPNASVDATDPATSGVEPPRDLYRLRRDVRVSWRAGGRTRTRTLTQLAAPPPDAISRSNPGAITVTGVPGVGGAPGPATLSIGSGFTVTHTADAGGTVRFPFLELGVAYPVSVNGAPRTPVTLTQELRSVVLAG